MKKNLLALLVCISTSVFSTTFTVLNKNDSGAGSLREAIAAANLDLTATFSIPHIIDATSINDTIKLNSQYDINNHIKINGPVSGNPLVIDGALTTNAFHTNFTTNNYYLEINNLSIINTRSSNQASAIFIDNQVTVVLNNCNFYNCVSLYSGGAIFNFGNLFVTNCSFQKDSVQSVGIGADIHNDANLYVRHSTFKEGYSNGGAISIGAGAVAQAYVDSCVFENNFSPFAGAGIYNDGGKGRISNSIFRFNAAGYGAAYFSFEVDANDSILNCTFENNHPISSNSGTIYSEKSIVYIENSTFSNNHSDADAGALYVKSNNVKVKNCTFWGNTSYGAIGGAINIEYGDTLDLENSIVIGNKAFLSGQGNDIYGVLKGNGHNIIGDTAYCNLNGTANNLVNLLDYNVIDTFLLNNGGFTKTHNLVNCSPAINHANVNAPLIDQRGITRYGVADAGALEADSSIRFYPHIVATASDDTICVGDAVTLYVTGANTYFWMPSVANGQSLLVSPTSTSTYTVTGTSIEGCSNNDIITIEVVNYPVVAFNVVAASDTLCSNENSISLTASPSGGTFTGTGISASNFNPATANLGWNVITYSYTNTQGCSASDIDSIWVDICTGINSPENSIISVYPNPTNGIIKINSNRLIDVISIEDLLGKEIARVKPLFTSTEIDITAYPKGVYFVKMLVENSSKTIKLIVQ